MPVYLGDWVCNIFADLAEVELPVVDSHHRNPGLDSLDDHIDNLVELVSWKHLKDSHNPYTT